MCIDISIVGRNWQETKNQISGFSTMSLEASLFIETIAILEEIDKCEIFMYFKFILEFSITRSFGLHPAFHTEAQGII